MIALVEGAERRKTPNEIALNILFRLTITFSLPVTAAVRDLRRHADVADYPDAARRPDPDDDRRALSAIDAGMDRLVQRNVLAMSGRAVEALGR
jgi:K+-transporting ATPase ATPase B chain